MSWAERSTGISPTITNSCSRTCWAGSTASTPLWPEIGEQIEARVAALMWKAILDTRVFAEDLGAASAPLVLARVECYTRRSAASRHPVAVARCGNQHVGGGCCASSRSLP